MTKFIVSANGTVFGKYEGATAAAALDTYAKDAGYRSYSDLLEETGFADEAVAKEVEVVDDVSLFELQDAWKRGFETADRDQRNRHVSENATPFAMACISDNSSDELAFEALTEEVAEEIRFGENTDITNFNEDLHEDEEDAEMDGESWAWSIGYAYRVKQNRAAA